MLIYFVLNSLITYAASEDKLLHVHAVWRHGERNPGKALPGDLNDVSAFPSGWGATYRGIHQMYALGKLFNKRYIQSLNFLSENYTSSEIYARSTDVDRTLVSAMAFYSGLYTSKTSKDLSLAPVPIHSMPTSDDAMNSLGLKCPKKDVLWKLVEDSTYIKKLLNASHELLEEVMNKTQMTSDFFDIMYVFDSASFEQLLGLPLPDWLPPLMPGFEALFVDYIEALWGFVPFPDDHLPFDLQLALSKISTGPLMNEIVDRLTQKIKCHRVLNALEECTKILDQKLYTYSAHDITEISLFLGLGFSNFTFEKYSMPSVASSITVELWERNTLANTVAANIDLDDYYYVKVWYYQNSTVKEPRNLDTMISECAVKGCPLSYLSLRADLLRPKPDFKIFCQLPPHNASDASFTGYNFAVTFITTFVFIYVKPL